MTTMPRLGVSSYSYWNLGADKPTLETVIERANALDLAGVELLQQDLESEDLAYLKSLSRHAFQNGITLYNMGTGQDFVWDDPTKRQQNVEHTKRCIDVAHELGVSSIRVNAGLWRRDDSFAGLVDTKGWSTPWEGATKDDGFAWAIEGLGACTDHAAERGVMLLLENHWGLTTYADDMLRVLEGVNSPWLRAIMDMGNFYYDGDMYGAMEKIATWVDVAHAKTYPGGGAVFTIDIDYTRVFKLLRAAGFRGYVTLEMEGKESATTAVPKSVELLTEAWNNI